MNPKFISKLFSSKGKAQAGVSKGVSSLIISSVALSLVVLTAYIQVVPVNEPAVAVVLAQTEASGQNNIVLPTIDPADRKFFSPGYGLIFGVSKASIPKYLWSHSGGGLTELTTVRTMIPVQKYLWSHSGGGLTELTTVQTTIIGSINLEPAVYHPQ